MSRATPATRTLERARMAFTVHSYAYDPQAASVGLQAAAALGEVPARVLKTLMVAVDGKPACAILPSDRELAMKKVAAALGGVGVVEVLVGLGGVDARVQGVVGHASHPDRPPDSRQEVRGRFRPGRPSPWRRRPNPPRDRPPGR